MYGNIICIYLELLRYNIITAVTNYLAKATPIPNHVLSLFASLCLLENGRYHKQYAEKVRSTLRSLSSLSVRIGSVNCLNILFL